MRPKNAREAPRVEAAGLPHSGAGRRWAEPAAVALLLLLALVLRVLASDRSLWVDESMTFSRTETPGSIAEHYVRGSGDVHPPLYFAAFWLARRASSDVDFLRALFLPFALSSLFVIYRIGRLRGGPAVGLAALLLAAASPVHIRYSVELRPYVLLLCFSSIATFAFLRALAGGGTRDRVLFVSATVLNLYTHLFALLLYAVEALFLLLPRAGTGRPRRSDIAAGLLPLLLFLPWAGTAFGMAAAGRYLPAGGYLLPPHVYFVRTLLEYLSVSREEGPSPSP